MPQTHLPRAPNKHTNRRILVTNMVYGLRSMVYGIYSIGYIVYGIEYMRISNSGPKVQYKGDTRNHGVRDPCVYVVFWAPTPRGDNLK